MRAALVACVALAGCTPVEKLVRVEVPVPVRCVAEIPGRPDLVTDPQLRGMSDYQLVLSLWRDRKQRAQYEAELEGALAGCR